MEIKLFPISEKLERLKHPPHPESRRPDGDPLDVPETSVGLKADPPPQGGQVEQPLADAEVARVVDRRLGPQGAAFLVILLDP